MLISCHLFPEGHQGKEYNVMACIVFRFLGIGLFNSTVHKRR